MPGLVLDMMYRTFSRLSCLVLAVAGLSFALPILADTPFHDKDKEKQYIPKIIKVSLIRQNDKSGEAHLHLSTDVALNGCPKVTPLIQTMEIDPPFLAIHVEGYTVDFNNLPRNPVYACKTGMQFSTTDIPLDRKLIEDNHLTTIRLSLGKGRGSDTYNIILDKNRLQLVAGSDTTFEAATMPYGGQVALTHWYYPARTLVLTAPVAPGSERDQTVRDFAHANGLTPLETMIPDFIMPSGQANRHYYVDQSGKIFAKVSSHDDVSVSDLVYARRPGTYE